MKFNKKWMEFWGILLITVFTVATAQSLSAFPAHPWQQRIDKVASDYRTASKQYSYFIGAACDSGLPVTLLNQVENKHTIAWGSSNYFDPVPNQLNLSRDTLNRAAEFRLGDRKGGSEIGTTYHESAHGYLDLMENDPKFKAFIEDGQKYYQNAPLENGQTVKDPNRVFHEAVAIYVENRIYTWLSTLNNLKMSSASNILNDKSFNRIQRDYNREMAKEIFGYEQKYLGKWGEQIHTTKPLSPEMKKFIDREILEGKIPDNFDSEQAFTPPFSVTPCPDDNSGNNSTSSGGNTGSNTGGNTGSRQSGTGGNKQGTSYGDPHIITFNGYRYSFQMVGEFLLAKSTDGAFEVQTRQSNVPGRQLSLNTAVAMKVGNNHVAIYTQNFPDSDPTPLRVNDKPTILKVQVLSFSDGGFIKKISAGDYVVQWATGEQVVVRMTKERA